jgi:hypothetical protein
MEDPAEPPVIRFLRESGLELTPDDCKAVMMLQNRADQAQELMMRVGQAFPIKRDVAALKARWERKDPNIVATRYDDGRVNYEREFTDAQREELKRGYLNNRPCTSKGFTWEQEASIFVRIIEGWAASIDLFQASIPPEQKTRVRAIKAVGAALVKLDDALAALDSDALGFLYAALADDLATVGLGPEVIEGRPTAMVDDRLRAAAEAGEGRKTLRFIISRAVNASTRAAKELPLIDRAETDPRFVAVQHLERLMLEHQLPFEANETGYAAQCVRAMFELADAQVEKVGYWIRKAIDHPRSHARWLKQIRDRVANATSQKSSS